MADEAFDRVVAYDLSVLSHTHLNRLMSQFDVTVRELVRQFMLRRSSNFSDSTFLTTGTNRNGFIGPAFRPTWTGGMNLQLTAGIGFLIDATTTSDIDSVTGLDDLSALKPLVLPSSVTVAVPTADATHPRIDLIEVKQTGRRDNSESLVYLSNPTNGTLTTASFLTNFGWAMSASDLAYVTSPASSTTAIGYKTGVPGASPATPSVTSGYVAVGYVYVPAAAVSLGNQYVYDRRPLVNPGTVRVVLSKDAGTGGGLTLYSVDAPPGVEVRVVEDTGTKCAFKLYVIAPNAKAVNDAMPSVKGLAHTVTVSQDAITPSETVQAKSAAGVTLLGGTDVTNLANAALTHPTALTTAIDIDRYYYYVSVSLMRNNATSVDFNLSNATLVTVTFDIPYI